MTDELLIFERSLYIGGQITTVLYGIHLVLYTLSNRLLLRGSGNRDAKFYIAFGTALVILWTIALSCNAVFGQYMWIEHRDVEGGPGAYMLEHISDWYNTWGTAAGIMMNFMSDGLLLYRCFIIWDSMWLIVAFPIILYFGAMSMSILLIYESAQPGSNFFRGRSVSFGVPYVSMTIALNIIVTMLIVIRLLALRNKVRRLLGPKHAEMYTSIAAIVVESAAPFTLLGIAYLITYERHSNVSLAFVQVWGDFCALSPQFIILRVAMGKGWTKDTAGRVSTNISFDHDRTQGSSEGTQQDQYKEEDTGFSTTRHDSGEKIHEISDHPYAQAV